MGEVGNTIAEDPPVQKKHNGELNGNHAVDEDQEMEIENNSTAAKGGAQVEVKKISLDADSNEPAVEPIARETNGKRKNDSDVMEIDDNGSHSETDPLANTEEVNVSGDGLASDQDITMNSEKDVLALPKENRNRSNNSESAVVLSDTSDEDEDGTSTTSSKYRSAERSAVPSENEGGFSNGPTSTNQSRLNDDDDDDKPVSIHSDSDDEKDCIMIPDEKGAKLMPSNLSMKATISSMTNSSQMMNNRKSTHQMMTDFDDDIEEIIEDPLDTENMSTAKRLKLSGTSITSVDLSSRPSSSSSASSAYPVNLSTKTSTGNSQALNLSTSKSSSSSLLNPFAHTSSASLSSSGTSLLPNLTDDMFVLEAPSFIVPYIYEKPSGTDLKSIVNEIAKTIVHKETEKRSFDEKSSGAESELMNSNQKSTENSDREDKKTKDSSKRAKRGPANGDESWDEYATSTDDEASGDEKRTKVLIKESHADMDSIKPHITGSDQIVGESKNDSYFDSPIGKFFMTIGINLVQEHVQADLLRQQKRKREKEGKAPSASTQMAINSLQKSLEISKQNNAPFKHKLKRCENCAFKTESDLVLSNHYEVPHYRNNIYRCNYCEYEARPVHDILYHVEAIHNMKGRLDKPMSYHQCPNCQFEDNGKSKMVRHEVACAKKFKPENNMGPPLDWEPPAKIPRIKAKHGLVGAATAYQAMAAQQQQRAAAQSQLAANLSALQRNNTTSNSNNSMKRGRNQSLPKSQQPQQQQQLSQQNSSNLYKNTANAFKNFNPNLLSNNYQLAAATLAAANTQFLQQVVAQKLAMLNPAAAAAAGSNFLSSLTSAAAAAATAQAASASSKSKSSGSTPSISITPLPRTQQQQQQQPSPNIKPGQSPNSSGQKNQFVICEICDGYIKDLDQLRNHMQWIHKVKIHPKMIYNRPPLNCQKCQYRFFTDQGLERHLLGSHGLVTSSMQEAANNGKDSGRCPVCGKVFQWKLLNHVSRDHNMTLKPAHLSYKCTVCTATFGMYKLFENHVYSAHSTVAKKDNNKNKSSTSTASSSSSSNSLLKPLRINDEITIIPQPAKKLNDMESHVID